MFNERAKQSIVISRQAIDSLKIKRMKELLKNNKLALSYYHTNWIMGTVKHFLLINYSIPP